MGLPYITIGIPVFNGERFMLETLESAKEAIQAYVKNQISLDELVQDKQNHKNLFLEEIEIVVSNNASTDETLAVCTNFKRQNPFIRMQVFSNKENLGFDKNVDLLFRYASGKYVWTLGCGETIHRESLIKIVNFCRVHNPLNLILNYTVYSESKLSITDESMPILGNRLSCGSRDFKYPRYALALSSNVIKRRNWRELEGLPLITNGWVHVERVLHSIGKVKKALTGYIGDPCVTFYREIDGWYASPDAYKMHLLHLQILKCSEKFGISDDIANKLINPLKYYPTYRAIAESRRNGLTKNCRIARARIRISLNGTSKLYALIALNCPKNLLAGIGFIPRIHGFIIKYIDFLKYSRGNNFD